MSAAGFALEDWQIRMVLPHRPPVLQLDRIDRCESSLTGLAATKAVGLADPMLRRHPGDGRSGLRAFLAPGALIEALAQCCGLLVRLRWLSERGIDLMAFAAGHTDAVAGLDIPRSVLAESQAKFSAAAAPGDIVALTTRLVLSRGGMHRFTATASGSLPILAADLMLKFPHSD